MVCPMRSARVSVPGTIDSFNWRPVIGNSAIMAVVPISIQMVRARRSVQWLSIVLMMEALPFSSAMAMGVAAMPYMVGVTIWISGKARPVPYVATRGVPDRGGAVNGWVGLCPPAWVGLLSH